MIASLMPWTLMSICSAVTPSRVPVTLKSMSPIASSLPRMSVRTDEPAVGLGDEAHGRAGDGRLDRHARVHQGEGRAAGRCHRRRAVRRDALADEADHVWELLLARQHRHEGPLGEVAVADVAPAGAAHRLVLAGAVRREVVVVDVALLGLRADRVDPLDVRGRAERGHGQGLRLAAGEEPRAMRTRDEAHLDRDRSDVGQAATVDPDALVDDDAAHGLLLDQVEQALADSGVATSRVQQRVGVATLALGPDRVGDRRLQLRDPARQVVGEPEQEARGRLGVRQGAMALAQLDAEEARQVRSLYDSAPGSPRGR